jgi:hypothetical protein
MTELFDNYLAYWLCAFAAYRGKKHGAGKPPIGEAMWMARQWAHIASGRLRNRVPMTLHATWIERQLGAGRLT